MQPGERTLPPCLRASRSSASSTSASSSRSRRSRCRARFERGEVIFREGDTGDTLLRRPQRLGEHPPRALRRPHARARRAARGRHVRRARDVRRRDPLGHRRGARAPPRSWPSWAATSSACCAPSPDIALKMLAALADRLRAANERLLQQSFQTVAGRVASALLAQVIARQAEGAGDDARCWSRDAGGDRPAGRHLARERQPLPGHAGARGRRRARARQGDRA